MARHLPGRCSPRAVVAWACLFGTGAVAAAPPPTTAPADPERRNADLQRRVAAAERELDELTRAARPPAPPPPAVTARSFFLDNQPVTLPGDVAAGFKDGFYLHQGTEFGIQANALFDARYNYADLRNKTGLTTTPLGRDAQGSTSGFNLFAGQVSVQGYLFHHGEQEAFFKAMGNFGTLGQPSVATDGQFTVNELYGGYAASNGLRVRAGSMPVPFTPLRSVTDYGGLLFPDPSDVTAPFSPGFALGVDVLGALADNTVSYDVMACNGTTSNFLTNSAAPLAGRDNRVAVYTREQVVGSGRLKDFVDESDVTWHDHFAWVVGGAFGFESQNGTSSTTTNAPFPGPQTTLGIVGLSAPAGVGFLPRQALTGDAYRATADARGKYRGLSFEAEGFYQRLTSAGPVLVAGYPRHSVGQTGFYAQSGYFLVPRRLEVAGRFGQLYADGLPHEMDEWTFGVNYYLFGQNLKVQLAETYVPRQAALTSGNGIVLNTQDWLTQVQVQAKF